KFSFGTSYQRFRFDSLDGIDLHNVPAVFRHVPGTGSGGIDEPYEADVIRTNNSISLNMDQTMIYGTVGLTDSLDVSVSVPIVSVRMGASSSDTIVRVSGPTFIPTGTTMVVANPHEFDANGSLSKIYSSNGSASGLGDITVRAKARIFQRQDFRVSVAMDVRTPSGNAREFLGAGAIGLKPFVIVSTGKRFSPHLNLGYEWNGSSILAGNITGTEVFEDANGNTLISKGPATKERLPGQLYYA